MNAFLNVLERYDIKGEVLRRCALTTLQVNMGDLCNQSCAHCHINASPVGKKIMSRAIVDECVRFLTRYRMRVLDITGGAPEMNPHFTYFVEKARPLVDELIVRSNLTVLLEKGNESLPSFFKEHRIHLICSLPCYGQKNVDQQRGKGVFQKSIKALSMLNEIGYGKTKGLQIDLVYNPSGTSLPPEQSKLEQAYKQELKNSFNIDFDRLLTITNVAINKFKDYLDRNNEYDAYAKVLTDNFNPKTVENLMCRSFISVAWDGKLYDCDFNQALGLVLKDTQGKPLTISRLDPDALEDQEIVIGEHCLSCTAGCGSGCQGALVKGTEETSCGIGIQDSVKEYYGKRLQSNKDLKTSACCSLNSLPRSHREILKNIEPEILEKFYGCGSPLPPLLEGCTILDLGSGTGRDVYIAAYLAGENGRVIGVDMTDEQLAVAERHRAVQMKRFGFKRCTVEFKKGYIEDLKALEIADSSIDVVISNCVLNLSPDKSKVFAEIFRVLKSGGELYFADVFADRRLPEALRDDSVLVGECLGGAMYVEDFRRMLMSLGCNDYRVVASRQIILQEDILAKVGVARFFSMTIRAFKLKELEDRCEDFGQVAVYNGTIPDQPHSFILDDHHEFITGKPMLVCGNTAAMLSATRYSPHFTVMGDKQTHFGLFPCGPSVAVDQPQKKIGGCC